MIQSMVDHWQQALGSLERLRQIGTIYLRARIQLRKLI